MEMDSRLLFYLCLLISVLGVLGIAALIATAVYLSRRGRGDFPSPGAWEFFFDHLLHKSMRPNEIPRYLAESYTEYLQRRNEFVATLGQLVISALIIATLSVLLLTKTISAEAGLPILSGVTGFAIAKGVNTTRGMSHGPEQQLG